MSLSLAKFPKAAMILGMAAAKVSCTDSSDRLLTRVKQGRRFTKYGLHQEMAKKTKKKHTSLKDLEQDAPFL